MLCSSVLKNEYSKNDNTKNALCIFSRRRWISLCLFLRFFPSALDFLRCLRVSVRDDLLSSRRRWIFFFWTVSEVPLIDIELFPRCNS